MRVILKGKGNSYANVLSPARQHEVNSEQALHLGTRQSLRCDLGVPCLISVLTRRMFGTDLELDQLGA